MTETMILSDVTPVTETTPVVATPPRPSFALLPQYTKTMKRGAARTGIKEPEKLLAYAIEHGGTITLTPDVIATLVSRGLPAHRITNAAYGLRKFYGLSVTAIRTGRKVTGYTVAMDTPAAQ